MPEKFQAPAPETPLKFMATNKVDAEAILRIYSQHTCGTVRTVEEIRKYLTIPNSRVFTAWSEDNKLQAYAVEGKEQEMMDSLQSTLAAYPRAMEPRLVKARYYIAKGQLEKVSPLFEELTEEQKQHPGRTDNACRF